MTDTEVLGDLERQLVRERRGVVATIANESELNGFRTGAGVTFAALINVVREAQK